MSAHLSDLPKGMPIKIWFQDEARIDKRNGVVCQRARWRTTSSSVLRLARSEIG
jgi:hypothetical protein